MSTNPEGNQQTAQDVIAALHLKLHHVEVQRDSAMAILKADMKQIAAGVLYEEVGSLKAENARLKAEVERLTDEVDKLENLCDFLEGKGKQ